jgi:TatD DNase family protein
LIISEGESRLCKVTKFAPARAAAFQKVFINTHTHAQIYDASIELVNVYPGEGERPRYFSCGLHPRHIRRGDYRDRLDEVRLTAGADRCLAVGECGIDKLSDVDLTLQEEVFTEQVRIANEVQKPLLIHCVKGFNELINCLQLNDNQMPVIIHGFNNNENTAALLADHGCYFSFGKALLGYDSNASRAIRNIGRRKFFLETDDADVSIKYIYRKAAELLGIAEDIVQQQISNNFETVFGIKISE